MVTALKMVANVVIAVPPAGSGVGLEEGSIFKNLHARPRRNKKLP